MPVTSRRFTLVPAYLRPIAALFYGLCGLCGTAQALQFDIAEQDLATALMQFSQQSGLNVVRDGSLSGLRSTAVNGDYSGVQALRLLLAATGLEFEPTASGMRLINPQTQADEGAYQLPATDIIGTQNPTFDKYKTPEIKYEVTREQLDRVPYSRIGDIFNGVPGVASANSANGAALELNIRGLQGMGRVKTLVDGSMQTTNTYRGYAGNRDSTFIDPDLIGSIDIKKGPDAGPQGAGVIGGIVNMRSINATDIITDPNKNWGIRIMGMYGNNVARDDYIYKYRTQSKSRTSWAYDSYQVERRSGRGQSAIACRSPAFGDRQCNGPNRISDTDIGGALPTENRSGSLAAAFRPWNNFELTLAYAERESGNYYHGKRGKNLQDESNTGYQRDDKNDAEVANSSYRSESWLAKSKLYFAEVHSVELSHIKYRTQHGESVPGLDSTAPPVFAQGHLKNAETATYSLSYAYQPDNPLLDLRANLWKSRLTSETPRGIYNAFFGFRDSEVIVDSKGGELWNTSRFNLPLGELALKYGASFSRETAYGFQKNAGNRPILDTVINGSRHIFGAFSQANWQVTPWLSFNAALQQTKGKLQDNTKITRIGWERLPVLPVNRQSALDPSYGFTLEPHQSVQLFAQWSQGSRMPTIREALNPAADTGQSIPNPELKMEKAKNFEYGINLLFSALLSTDDRLGIKFSKFDNKYKDYIARQNRRLMGETRPYPQPYPYNDYKFTNIDKARYQGYELSADYDNGWLFANFSLVHFDRIQYCYITDANNFRSGRPIVPLPSACYDKPPATDYVWGNYVPPTQEKNAGLGLRLFGQKLLLGATMKMAGKGPELNTRQIGAVPVYKRWAGYEVYDLYGSLKLGKHLELGFSVENIRDRYYIPAYSGGTETQAAPGRTTRGMVTFRF